MEHKNTKSIWTHPPFKAKMKTLRKLYLIKNNNKNLIGNKKSIKSFIGYLHFIELIDLISDIRIHVPDKLDEFEKQLDKGLEIIIGEYKVKELKKW